MDPLKRPKSKCRSSQVDLQQSVHFLPKVREIARCSHISASCHSESATYVSQSISCEAKEPFFLLLPCVTRASLTLLHQAYLHFRYFSHIFKWHNVLFVTEKGRITSIDYFFFSLSRRERVWPFFALTSGSKGSGKISHCRATNYLSDILNPRKVDRYLIVPLWIQERKWLSAKTLKETYVFFPRADNVYLAPYRRIIIQKPYNFQYSHYLKRVC